MILYPNAIVASQRGGVLIQLPDPDTCTSDEVLYAELTQSVDEARVLSMDLSTTKQPGIGQLWIYWPDDITNDEKAAADALVRAHRPS